MSRQAPDSTTAPARRISAHASVSRRVLPTPLSPVTNTAAVEPLLDIEQRGVQRLQCGGPADERCLIDVAAHGRSVVGGSDTRADLGPRPSPARVWSDPSPAQGSPTRLSYVDLPIRDGPRLAAWSRRVPKLREQTRRRESTWQRAPRPVPASRPRITRRVEKPAHRYEPTPPVPGPSRTAAGAAAGPARRWPDDDCLLRRVRRGGPDDDPVLSPRRRIRTEAATTPTRPGGRCAVLERRAARRVSRRGRGARSAGPHRRDDARRDLRRGQQPGLCGPPARLAAVPVVPRGAADRAGREPGRRGQRRGARRAARPASGVRRPGRPPRSRPATPAGAAGATSRLGRAAARAMLRARAGDGAYAGTVTRPATCPAPGARPSPTTPPRRRSGAGSPRSALAPPPRSGRRCRPGSPATATCCGSFVYAQQVNQVKALGAVGLPRPRRRTRPRRRGSGPTTSTARSRPPATCSSSRRRWSRRAACWQRRGCSRCCPSRWPMPRSRPGTASTRRR